MKTKLSLVVVLALAAVLSLAAVLFVPGSSSARPSDLGNNVYLPIVAKPPCLPAGPTAYVSTSDPVVRVGETLTVVGALVNDCAWVGEPLFGVGAYPSGVLSLTGQFDFRYPSVPKGEYRQATFTLQAVNPGVVTVTTAMNYETPADGDPPQWKFVNVWSGPAVVRVLPQP